MTLALVLVLIALLVLDWRQTLTIFRTGRRELNPIIRWAYARWGTRGVDGYFACCIAAVLLAVAFVPTIAAALSTGWMRWILTEFDALLLVLMLVESAVVVRNHLLGIRP